MLRSVIALLAGFLLLVPVDAPAREDHLKPHLRPTSPWSAALIADGAALSRTVRGQLADLEHSDLVVYVALKPSVPGNDVPLASLRFLTRAGSVRYVLITVDLSRNSPLERIAYLGHELEHALEVARAPQVTDEAGFRRLYERIGHRDGRGRYETERARLMGLHVMREVRW